ncbi:conserved protein of unknown function [Pararobbsia alpina]|uniref:hypothetical protein n=1 Tax=Pararobbsia alpina TaxID=621374 RepID=UPI0039A42FE6
MTLGCAAAAAQAQPSWFQFEASLGGSGYSKGPDGYWYQDGFRHNLQLTAPAVEVGFAGNLYDSARWGVDWHADYAWLGTIHTDAWAVPVDANYNTRTKGCNGPCMPLAEYKGSGHEAGFLFTLEPYFKFGDGQRIGIEAGPFVHRATWNMQVSDWQANGVEPATSLNLFDTNGWRVGAVAGLTYSYGRVSLVYQHFFTKSAASTSVPPIWHSVDMLTMRYTADIF